MNELEEEPIIAGGMRDCIMLWESERAKAKHSFRDKNQHFNRKDSWISFWLFFFLNNNSYSKCIVLK